PAFEGRRPPRQTVRFSPALRVLDPGSVQFASGISCGTASQIPPGCWDRRPRTAPPQAAEVDPAAKAIPEFQWEFPCASRPEQLRFRRPSLSIPQDDPALPARRCTPYRNPLSESLPAPASRSRARPQGEPPPRYRAARDLRFPPGDDDAARWLP